jgi:protein-L-isoaspartate(D-aspartate) O-methyltransferase
MGTVLTDTDSRGSIRGMVRSQIKSRGIHDPRVLDAMMRVQRDLFVPEQIRHCSFEDNPLPIGYGQTISQPFIVALMTQMCGLTGSERVLEIGTGSGYQSAVLSLLCGELFTIERIPELSEKAESTLTQLGYKNISYRTGSGYDGWPEYAPFDAIIVTACPPKVPEALFAQLKEGGVLVSPEGNEIQQLLRITKRSGSPEREAGIYVRFVRMTE